MSTAVQDRADESDARRVPLSLLLAGIEGVLVERDDDVVVGALGDRRRRAQAEDLRGVQRNAGTVFLAVPNADPWMGRHDDARLSLVDARLPRAVRVRDDTVDVFSGVLAEVPDVAGLVLRVPVGRLLLERAILRDDVLDDGAPYAQHDLRPVRHREDVHRRLPVPYALVRLHTPGD